MILYAVVFGERALDVLLTPPATRAPLLDGLAFVPILSPEPPPVVTVTLLARKWLCHLHWEGDTRVMRTVGLGGWSARDSGQSQTSAAVPLPQGRVGRASGL